MSEETATFALRVDADAEPAAEAAAELEKFRSAIVKSQDAIANYRKSMSLLKGSSDEVKSAKEKLKAAIAAEQGAVTKANLGILKLGGSYDKLSKAAKKTGAGGAEVKKAISSIGGPVAGLTEKFEGLKGLLPVVATGWGAVAVAVAASVAAIAIAAAAVADLTLKFTQWLATTADANRNLSLTREAFSGSAKNATAWGHVLDWASEKTALTTQAMNDLVVETEKIYRGFRISGQGMVDAFKASAAAAGAGRKDVADFFNEILSRGKQTGRTFINYQDFARFRNAGIPVQEMYKALGITAAQAARGAVVSTDRMAAALAKVSQNRFAEINQKKMLSLGAQWDRLKDNFMRFTNDLAGEGGALEPLLKAIQQVASAFDLSTDSGQEMKAAITKYGKALADAIVNHLPEIKAFVKEAIHLAGAFIEGAAAVYRWTQSANGAMVIKAILIAIGVTVGVLAVAFGILAATVALPFVILAGAIYGVMKAVDWIRNIKWGDIGKAIVDGIRNGLESAWEGLKGAVSNMGEGIKSTFKKILGIASPSREFGFFARMTVRGYQQEIVRGQPNVRAATAGLAGSAMAGAEASIVAAPLSPAAPMLRESARAGFGGGGGRGPNVGTIENHFHIQAGNADQVKAALSSRSFLEQFETSLKVILQSQGIPTGVAVPSGG